MNKNSDYEKFIDCVKDASSKVCSASNELDDALEFGGENFEDILYEHNHDIASLCDLRYQLKVFESELNNYAKDVKKLIEDQKNSEAND